MTHTSKTRIPPVALFAAMVFAAALGMTVESSDAKAQATTCCFTTGTVTTPTTPTTPTNIPTPPPVIKKPEIPVVVVTPTPPARTPPAGMFNNVPSDMSRMTDLGSINSINRLLSTPAAVSLSIPRQAVLNTLENRLPLAAPLNSTQGASNTETAIQALENAKPLI